MKFLTPAFVRVENPQERKELAEWLEGIGYRFYENDHSPNSISTNVTIGDAYLGRSSEYGKRNCGTNIPLFKALAAMNDENDREQWFICVKDHVCGDADDFESYFVGDMSLPWNSQCPGIWWRKATVEEIINYFKPKP